MEKKSLKGPLYAVNQRDLIKHGKKNGCHLESNKKHTFLVNPKGDKVGLGRGGRSMSKGEANGFCKRLGIPRIG